MTVWRTVENLIELGLVERRSTSGTYVTHPQIARRVGSHSLQGLTELLWETGAELGSRLLSFTEAALTNSFSVTLPNRRRP